MSRIVLTINSKLNFGVNVNKRTLNYSGRCYKPSSANKLFYLRVVLIFILLPNGLIHVKNFNRISEKVTFGFFIIMVKFDLSLNHKTDV